MAWTTPKTDWVAGDYFNATDYNRIKNNLAYLYDLAISLYSAFDARTLGSDKSVGELFYADEIDDWEYNLDAINVHTIDQDYGDTKVYNDNDKMPNYVELNRIESATLSLYSIFNNQIEGRRHFEFNLGIGGMF